MRKIYALVGYSHWGKSTTLYQLFDNRRKFYSLRAPITSSKIPNKKFVVINPSNEDQPTSRYLSRLKQVLATHKASDVNFVITISLYFSGSHEVQSVFEYLNSLKGFDVNYILLEHGWDGKKLHETDVQEMKQCINQVAFPFNDVIRKSKKIFLERTMLIADFIRTDNY